jgi:hypothetical protein
MKTENNCRVLGTGDMPADFAHISTATPMDTKMKEMENDQRYRTNLTPDINQSREKAVSRARRTGNVRPL